MVRGKLWPINHPSLLCSLVPCLTALSLHAQFYLGPKPQHKVPPPDSSPWPSSGSDWRRIRHVTGARPMRMKERIEPCLGDQLSRVWLFSYLPQKLNLKYEMYICSSCIWGQGTHRGSCHWTWCDNPKHVAKWRRITHCFVLFELSKDSMPASNVFRLCQWNAYDCLSVRPYIALAQSSYQLSIFIILDQIFRLFFHHSLSLLSSLSALTHPSLRILITLSSSLVFFLHQTHEA